MSASRGVDLPAANRSATAAFDVIMRAAADRFPALAPALGGVDRKHLGESLVRFEALRASLPAPQRVDAAKLLVRAAADRLVYAAADGLEIPLAEYMRHGAAPIPVEKATLGARSALQPRIPYGGTTYANADIVREHAKGGRFPANVVSEVKSVMDVATGEG